MSDPRRGRPKSKRKANDVTNVSKSKVSKEAGSLEDFDEDTDTSHWRLLWDEREKNSFTCLVCEALGNPACVRKLSEKNKTTSNVLPHYKGISASVCASAFKELQQYIEDNKGKFALKFAIFVSLFHLPALVR